VPEAAAEAAPEVVPEAAAAAVGEKRAREEEATPEEDAAKKAADLGGTAGFDEYLAELSEADYFDEAVEDELCLNLLVGRAFVGAVIGKGGQVIKAITAETGCQLRFQRKEEPCPFPEGSKVTLKGKIVQIVKATHLISRIVEKSASNTEGAEIPIVAMLPQAAIGVVIGKKGVTIQELSSKSEAKMQFERENVHPAMKRLTVEGEPAKRTKAMYLVMDLLKEKAELPEGMSAMPRPGMSPIPMGMMRPGMAPRGMAPRGMSPTMAQHNVLAQQRQRAMMMQRQPQVRQPVAYQQPMVRQPAAGMMQQQLQQRQMQQLQMQRQLQQQQQLQLQQQQQQMRMMGRR